jgi:hypothetical protein
MIKIDQSVINHRPVATTTSSIITTMVQRNSTTMILVTLKMTLSQPLKSLLSICKHFLLLFFLSTFLEPSSRCQALANRKGKAKRTIRNIGGSKGFGIVPPPPLQKYTVDTSPSTQKLLQFLDDEEVEGLKAIEIGFSNNNLRGMYAKESIQQGEYICAIPFVSTILVDETFINGKDENLLSANKIENAIQFQKILETDYEKWKPYFDCLPSTSDETFDATPDFWSNAEIQQLEVPSFVKDMLARKEELNKASSSNDSDFNLQLVAWLVRSRAFTTLKKALSLDPDEESIINEGLLQRTVLIPLLDFLNHDSTKANTELQVIETKAYDESFYALTATDNIDKGSELRIQYGTGKETSMELFGKYGFLPRNNKENDLEYLQTIAHNAFSWSTSLEDDKKSLVKIEDDEKDVSEEGTIQTVQMQILSLRIYLKEILQEIDGSE